MLSLDDHDLFLSNWLHGDLRHYDVSDPRNPVLRSQVWLGGLLGRDGGHPKAPGPLNGGPQMLQNSLDGDRVYVSNSLFSTWDNQFYPGDQGMADQARTASPTAATRSTPSSSSTSTNRPTARGRTRSTCPAGTARPRSSSSG